MAGRNGRQQWTGEARQRELADLGREIQVVHGSRFSRTARQSKGVKMAESVKQKIIN